MESFYIKGFKNAFFQLVFETNYIGVRGKAEKLYPQNGIMPNIERN